MTKNNLQGGFTLIETLVVMALASALIGIVAFNLRDLRNPEHAAAMEVMTFIKQARGKAIASTQAYTVVPSSSTKIITTYGSNCSSVTQTPDTAMTLKLPSGASMPNTAWSVCFEARGFSRNAVDIYVTQDGKTDTVQVVLGGAARVI